jgi:hypothetical protein
VRLALEIPIRWVCAYESRHGKKRLLVVDDENGSAIACRVVLEHTERFVVKPSSTAPTRWPQLARFGRT